MRRMVLLFAVAAMAAGCDSGVDCGPGTKADGDACVPVGCDAGKYLGADGKCVDLPKATECGEGTVLDAQTGECVQKSCPEGQYLGDGGNCVALPAQTECGAGTVLDEESGECVQMSCPEGQYLDPTGTCVALPAQTECGAGTVLDEESGECVKISCPEGEYLDDTGTCVALPEQTECGEGTELDETTGECVPVCVAGTHQVEGSGACLPDSAACQSGQVWDNATAQCIEVTGFCAEGTTWSASASACVTDDSLLVADQYEGTGENDLNFGDTAETFTLPASGAYVIGGTVSTATDKDGDGIVDADFDWWIFETTSPTLVRVAADGIGGTSSGFAVTAVDQGVSYARFGIGSTSDGATRDLYLPKAGMYAIVATDAMNFLATPPQGPAVGGPNYGYLITVERLPVPTATELVLSSGSASSNGVWPVAAPASGSMLGFYQAQLDALTLYELGLQANGQPFAQALLLFDENGYLGEFDVTGTPMLPEAATTLTLVADYHFSFATADVPYTVSVASRSTLIPGDTLPKTTLSQPAWSAASGEALPWQYFVFEGKAGEVVDVVVETVSGETAIVVADGAIQVGFAMAQGNPGALENRAHARFYPTYTGGYVIEVIGLRDIVWGWDGPERIPEQSFSLKVDIQRQEPADIGQVSAPVTLSAQTIVEGWGETYYTMPAAEGELYRLEATSSDMTPALSVYDTEVVAPLTRIDGPSGRLLYRAGTAAPLFAVADMAAAGQGTFELVVTPITVTDLGQVSGAAPINAAGESMPAVSPGRFFTLTAGATGNAQVTVAPAAGLDVELIRYDTDGQEIGWANGGGAGAAESFALGVFPGDVVLFEVATVGTLAADSTFDIGVTLDEFPFETEVNDDTTGANLLDVTTPAQIYGQIDRGNLDWFKVVLTAYGRLSAETFAFGPTPVGDTKLWVYAADGATELAYNDDKGPNWYSAVNGVAVTAGTYYVVVGGYGDAAGGYRLFVSFEETVPPTILGDITPGTPIDSEITVSGELDWWRLTLTERSNVVAETFAGGPAPIGDTKLWLYRAPDTTNHIVYNDDKGDYYSRINSLAQTGAPLEPGEYFVVVGGYSAYVGSYRLDVTVDVPPPPPAESEPNSDASNADTLDFNVELEAELSAGDSDWFVVTTTSADQEVTFQTTPAGNGALVDTVITVYGQDGTTVLGADDDSGPAYFSRLTLRLPTPDTYFVEVTGYAASSSGAYLLQAASY